jgi:acyl-CoA thioesterase YciA
MLITNEPEDYILTYRVLAMPADTNARGDIFGGWLMSQVDIAGSVLAIKEAEGRVATVAVKEFLFQKPVYVGDLVSCYARVERIGNTSITIHVQVKAARQRQEIDFEQVAEASLVYVALDGRGSPRSIAAN